MNIQELQSFLNENDIPVIRGKPKTFLGIAKQPHYENVVSNIYAFYFNGNEAHRLKDLFIKSLLEIINTSLIAKNTDDFETFLDFTIRTEYGTKNQKRIDLLLQNNEQAIIIENKVLHELNNDLDEYYNEIKVTTKIGIVLSLHPISDIKHERFINITHLQLVSTVMQNLGSYMLNANDKYLAFLKDFCQNIINLSHPIMEKENIIFYYKNQEKINQLNTFKKKLKEHIISQVVDAGNRINGVNKYAPRANSFNDERLVYYVSPSNKNLMITVVYEKLLTLEKKMYIAVEMHGDLLKDRAIYNSIEFTDEEQAHVFAEHFKATDLTWSHFAIMHYQPTDLEISNLSQFIIDKLDDDHLLSIFKKLNVFILKDNL
ncbi:PD-(D/E)XK nuclease family protein [Flavobacterium ardleyense]|uniref:PD-(D/E)XK nuclease family protein n=1 Tax=Flavobacterium ardleyense TaxID=2038737 RepID=UPI00298CA27A|nr:PD-(D/E)XK nuclease family protein [Flavobacterium ardleyense]